jgi:amino acid transporter
MSYLALPVVIVFWIGGFIWKRTGWLRTDQIDVDTGRRELDWDVINADRAKLAAMSPVKRAFHRMFI